MSTLHVSPLISSRQSQNLTRYDKNVSISVCGRRRNVKRALPEWWAGGATLALRVATLFTPDVVSCPEGHPEPTLFVKSAHKPSG